MGCDGRFGYFMHPDAPLKLLSLEMVDSVFRWSERYHHVDSVVPKHPVNFSQHLAGIGVGSLPALHIQRGTITESKVPLSITASKEF